MAADVAAVIGNYQGEQLLPDCLASLRSQTRAPKDVIVVDGASRDRSIAVAESAGAQVLSCPNGGLGYLYNRGAAATDAPYVLFLNNDVALERTCIERLATELDRDPTRFAADPQQLAWESEHTIHARTTLRRGRLLHEYLPGLTLDPVVDASDVVATVSAHGAAMLVRRELHLALGGFDETFFLEWEDLDLCWRAWLRGWSTVYVPAAQVRHRVGAATEARDRAPRAASSHHNLVRFALKCLPRAAAARVVLGELLRLPRHPRAITTAMILLARESREIRSLRTDVAPSRALFEWMLQGQPGSRPPHVIGFEGRG